METDHALYASTIPLNLLRRQAQGECHGLRSKAHCDTLTVKLFRDVTDKSDEAMNGLYAGSGKGKLHREYYPKVTAANENPTPTHQGPAW